jgi:hypothetical protein
MKVGQMAAVIVRHHLVFADDEATCACGWSDLVPLYGYHLLGQLLAIEDAVPEDVPSRIGELASVEELQDRREPDASVAVRVPPDPPDVRTVDEALEILEQAGRVMDRRKAVRGSYFKAHSAEEVAAYYQIHSRDATAIRFGMSTATVARRVKEWEEASGTARRDGAVPHTPLRQIDLAPPIGFIQRVRPESDRNEGVAS